MKLPGLPALLVLLLCLLVMHPRPAMADDTFGIAPEKKLARALTELADTCYRCGEKARELGLYTNARSYFNHALGYDAEHKATRRVMGFKKRAGVWTLNEDLVPKDDKVPAARLPETEQKLGTETREIREKAAEALFKFVGDIKLAAEQRMLALYHALLTCPEHRPSQTAARTSVEQSGFKHALDGDAELRRKQWLEAAPAPEAFEEATAYETACGFPMVKRRAPWFITHFDIGETGQAWASDLTRLAEASRTRILEITGMPPAKAPDKDENRIHYTVFGNRERFAAFIEKCSGIEDTAHRAEVARASHGTPVFKPYGSVWLYEFLDNDSGLRDAIAHDVAYKEVARCTDGGGYWLAQGMGYLLSAQMNGTTLARFYGIRSSGVIDSGGKEALPGLGISPPGWRVRVALMLAGDKAPAPSHLAALRVNDYTNDHMALAFCWSEFLASRHAVQLKVYLESALKERMARLKEKKPQLTAAEVLARLYEALKVGEAGFMAEFKAWALSEYLRLPTGKDE